MIRINIDFNISTYICFLKMTSNQRQGFSQEVQVRRSVDRIPVPGEGTLGRGPEQVQA